MLNNKIQFESDQNNKDNNNNIANNYNITNPVHIKINSKTNSPKFVDTKKEEDLNLQVKNKNRPNVYQNYDKSKEDVPNKVHTDIEYKPYACSMILIITLVIFLICLIIALVPSLASANDIAPAITIPIACIIFCIILFVFILPGIKVLGPNDAYVFTLFGKYTGTLRKPGCYWVNPFMFCHHLSLKLVNLDSPNIKVNDKSGNPINIGGIVLWRVVNCAKATFDCENYNRFVTMQTETALRKVAYSFNYDKMDEDEISLKDGHEVVNDYLRTEISNHLKIAGVMVESAEITHLSYAKEIASVMLRRQQAEAVVAARKKIIEGAVSICGMALTSLKVNNIATFDEESASKLVSNLLVVLCSESSVNPVVNTSS